MTKYTRDLFENLSSELSELAVVCPDVESTQCYADALESLASLMGKRVYAIWEVDSLPDSISDIHISCGVGDAQWEGFFPTDAGAELNVTTARDMDGKLFHTIKFSAPSHGIEIKQDYWLSPSLLNDEDEAGDFGVK